MICFSENKKRCSIEALITKVPYKYKNRRLHTAVSISGRLEYVAYTPKLSALVDADTKAACTEISADKKGHSMLES
jgi:hypothetical protein